jgi:hypothetical protein
MRSSSRIGRAGYLLIGLLFLLGCKSLNPLCGSARPVPVLNSISPASITLSGLPSIFTLTANGSHFVSSSVVIFNGTALATTVVSSAQVTTTITASMIPATGDFTVMVQTPAGNSGYLGCDSGGTSAGLVLTVN